METYNLDPIISKLNELTTPYELEGGVFQILLDRNRIHPRTVTVWSSR